MLIDVSIPEDRSVIKKEAEKILQYADLVIEMQRMWSVKAKVIPVITNSVEQSPPEKLAGPQSRNSRHCMEPEGFTAFTSARHLSLPEPDQSIPFFPIQFL
jgi:hypothetical protein